MSTIATLDALPVEQWYGLVLDIPLHLITPDPENLRQEFDESDLLDLGKNIELLGQFDEISVFPLLREDGSWAGSFDLHDGERRWRAAQLIQLPHIRGKIVPRPSDEELLYKKVSRVMQTRSLSPDTKVTGLEKALVQLGVIDQPEVWDAFRERLGGGPEWPQLVRVLHLKPRVRGMLEKGQINFTIAQSIGRLPPAQQEAAAEYVIVNKINGRFFATEMAPYLLSHPDASPAQAFEHSRVGGWRQYTRTPYQKGHEPPLNERVEDFLDACVKWERAWEVVVHTGLVHEVAGNSTYEFRLRDAARRLSERASALISRIDRGSEREAAPAIAPPDPNVGNELSQRRELDRVG